MPPESHGKTAYSWLRYLRAWLLWFDANYIRHAVSWWHRNVRRHFCWRCERTTFHEHRRCARTFDELIAAEWRELMR